MLHKEESLEKVAVDNDIDTGRDSGERNEAILPQVVHQARKAEEALSGLESGAAHSRSDRKIKSNNSSWSQCTSTVSCCNEKDFFPNLSLIGCGAVLGVLCRIGLEMPAVSSYFAFMLPNFLGTAILAYIHEFRDSFRYKPVYLGIGTGFCGSLTTFSSWQEAAGQQFFFGSSSPSTMTAGEQAYLWFQVQIIGICVNLIGWDFGKHCSVFRVESHNKDELEGKKEPSRDTCSTLVLDGFAILFGVLTAVAIAVLTSFVSTEVTFSLCWGPFGAWTRWRLSKLNTLAPTFPVGTFLANVLGTGLIGMAFVLGLSQSSSTTQCDILKGFMDGYCGALSTVSTFVSELKSLHRTSAYIYGFISMIVAQVLFVIVVGGYIWSTEIVSSQGKC